MLRQAIHYGGCSPGLPASGSCVSWAGFHASGVVVSVGSVSGRDIKGMVFQLLLPVAAICLVLAILKVNIDPSSPTIALDFPALLQRAPVAAANLPSALSACAAAAGGAAGSAGAGACGDGILFRQAASLFLHGGCSEAAAWSVSLAHTPCMPYQTCAPTWSPFSTALPLYLLSGWALLLTTSAVHAQGSCSAGQPGHVGAAVG